MTTATQQAPLVGISYSVNNALQVTGFSRTRLYKYISANELPIFKVGGRTYIEHNDLVEFIARLKRGEISLAGEAHQDENGQKISR